MITRIINEKEIQKLRNLLAQSEKIVITGHLAPDGDAIGSSLGLMLTLPALASDFTYTYAGQALTYTVLDEAAKTCETKAGTNWDNAGNSVSGSLILTS